MRRIVSKHHKRKTIRRNQLILGAFLIFVMFGSVLGFALQGGSKNFQEDSSSTITHNGLDFENINGRWITNINGLNFVFQYNPQLLGNSVQTTRIINDYSQRPLYVNSENLDAESEIFINLGQIASRIQLACLEGEECLDKTLPTKTCEDNFISIKIANESGIRQDGNCVFIYGPERSLLRNVDSFLLDILGT